MQRACRLCLRAEQHDMTPLFSDDINDDECRLLRLQIADLCSIVISRDDDGLPKAICSRCKGKLRDAHEFVNLCKGSNEKLRERHNEDKSLRESEAAISVNGEKRKVARERKGKRTAGSSRSAGESRGTRARVSSGLYDPTLLQNGSNVEAANLVESDEPTDGSDLNFQAQETPSKERVYLVSGNCDVSLDNSKKQYLCDVCSRTFASMSGLRFHLKSHYGTKPYVCQFCDKSFIIPSYKKRHEKTHTGDKLLVCHICSTAFASSNGLKYHLRTHTGEADHHCGTCGKSFARYKYLKEHTFTHTGEKPYVCKLCGTAYGNSGSLFVHEKKCKLRHACDTLQKDASSVGTVVMV